MDKHNMYATNNLLSVDSKVKGVVHDRESNFELYRIIIMLLIIAHHYVVNSEISQIINSGNFDIKVLYFRLFGAWGKVGINCFVLITGYFMCTSHITLRKFLKLYLEIKFYQYAIWGLFFIFGMETFTAKTLIGILPFTNIGTSFTNAFMAFYLFIPFLNILVNNLSKKQHLALVGLLVLIYTIMEMTLSVTYNYLSWFTTLYFIASYIRFYGLPNNNSVSFWGWITLAIFILSCLSIVTPVFIGLKANYFFVVDSNHLFALLLAVSSFMLFKNIKIGYSKWINAIGATTFGVFLIHTRGDVMRQWLWYDIVDCGGHYTDTLWWLYPIVVVIIIFSICFLIDRIRILYLEKWCFKLIDPLLDKVIKSENRNQRKSRSLPN